MGNGPCTQFEQSVFDVIPYEAIWFDLDTPATLFDYLIYADIKLVRFEYLKQLVADRRLWPRRQEAEWIPNALVTIEELEEQRRLAKLQSTIQSYERYFSSSREWERTMERALMHRSDCDPEEKKEWTEFAELSFAASPDPNLSHAFSDNRKKSMLGMTGEFKCLSHPFRNLRPGVHLLTVSHCWESKQHPDPWASQLHRLVNIISEYQESVFEVTGEEHAECWIFIDFISLPQYPRNPRQQQFFQRAMKSMHMLYAHKAVDRVVRLEELTSDFEKLFAPNFIDIYHEEVQLQHHHEPTKQTHRVPEKAGRFGSQPFSELELNSTPYNARGWCIAETQWMSASNCIHGYAPMLPATFQKRVQEVALKFTHRSDATAVMQLQEMVFWKKAKACIELDAAWLPHDEFLLLTEALPHYVNLRELRIFHCDIRSELAVALVNALTSLGDLCLVRIVQCSISDEAASVLAEFFSNFEQIVDLKLQYGCVDRCFGDPRILALSLLDCQVAGAGQAALAEAGIHMSVAPSYSELLWMRVSWALGDCACDRRVRKAREILRKREEAVEDLTRNTPNSNFLNLLK